MGTAAVVPTREALPRHARLLVSGLVNPGSTITLGLEDWDVLVRVARASQLLGALATRIEGGGLMPACPEPVLHHLHAALNESKFVRRMAQLEMAAVARALEGLDVPLVALKGAAYIAGDLSLAVGRMLRDVDFLVPVSRLDEVEAALTAAGWRIDGTLDEYDQRYYRVWSHQIPPLRRAGHPLEVDVHHAILPPTGRIRPDTEALLRDRRPVDAMLFVPDPADQVVHAAVHLFQDSDLTSRLRDLVDIDALCRHYAAMEPGFWPRLRERARLHGAFRPVGYAVAFADAWLGTPVDDAFARAWRDAPRSPSRAWVVRRAALTLPPPHPDGGRTPEARRAERWMLARSQWLRMPPWLLAFHGAMKAWRALTGRGGKAATSAA